MALLVIGIFCIYLCKQVWRFDFPRYLQCLYYIPNFIPKTNTSEITELDSFAASENEGLMLLSSDYKKQHMVQQRRDLMTGILCSIISGIAFGSLLVPAQFVSREYRGWDYVFSFSMGALIMASVPTIILVIYHYIITKELIPFHVKTTFLPGMLSGILWSAGNAFRVFAVLYLGMAIGFPLSQLGLILSGLIGMIFFKEFSSWYSISMFSFATLLISAGAVLLSIYGRGFE